MSSSYDDILRHHPAPGRIEEGEIELIPIADADPAEGPYGIITENPYFRVIRDPVVFPSGRSGSFFRVLKGDPTRRVVGAAVIPLRVVPGHEAEIGLVHQYRHPPAGWMAEIPRGTIEPDETTAEAAVRELREETGLGEPELLIHLGDLVIDSGDSPSQCAHFIAVYLGEPAAGSIEPDATEAIADTIWRPFSTWLDSAQLTPFPGRPVGGVDAFTAGAVGLCYSTGLMPRLERAWRIVLEDAWESTRTVHRKVASKIRKGEGTLDVAAVGTPNLITEISRYLPRLRYSVSRGRTIRIEDATPVAIAWLAELPATYAITTG